MKRSKVKNNFRTFFVNKYGIAFSCDVYPTELVSDIEEISESDYSNINDFDTVYVISSALKDWFKKIYPILKKRHTKIILVTGDSIKNTPLGALGISSNMLYNIFKENIIIHWFCQNCDYKDPLYITPIPLGIDYHTINRKSFWGLQRTHYLLQDLYLYLTSHKSLMNFETRRYDLFCDIHLNKEVYNRQRREAFNSNFLFPKSFLLSNPVPRNKYWKMIKRCKYILAPRGNGNDTHRAWEAICLGVIPIVEKSSLDSLFDDLPVLFVRSYQEVSEKLLSNYSFPDTINYDKVRLDYWIELITLSQLNAKKEFDLHRNKEILTFQIINDSTNTMPMRNILSISMAELRSNPILILIIPFQHIRNYIFFLIRPSIKILKKSILLILSREYTK